MTTFFAGYYEIPVLASQSNGAIIAPLGFVAQVAAMAAIAHAYFQAKTTLGSIQAGPQPNQPPAP